ncbi:RtcB family protein, partial [Chryseosolibacter indicus]
MNLTGNDLKQLGFIEGKALGLALDLLEKQYSDLSFDEKLSLLKQILNNPSSFINDTILAPIAAELLRPADETIALHVNGKSYQIYGAEAIEQGALQQMETAMKLPVTVAGALMPDAHQGYGLPIGGVLATNNAVIPYGVGVDIGCRMCMTIYDIPIDKLQEKREDFKKLLVN